LTYIGVSAVHLQEANSFRRSAVSAVYLHKGLCNEAELPRLTRFLKINYLFSVN